MWTHLGKPAALHLRRVFFSPGSDLRLRFEPRLPVGFTPLFQAPHLAAQLGAGAANLYLKNDAVCLPTLSFKDRVVAVALSQARAFGFDTVSCSSTGNLANAVAAHAAREG